MTVARESVLVDTMRIHSNSKITVVGLISYDKFLSFTDKATFRLRTANP